jgi:ferrous iron transport protein A
MFYARSMRNRAALETTFMSASAPPIFTTLETLRPGDRATICELRGDADTAARLMEMGLVAGTPVEVVKYAPLGDPMEILVRGYHFSLRRAEAQKIAVSIP